MPWNNQNGGGGGPWGGRGNGPQNPWGRGTGGGGGGGPTPPDFEDLLRRGQERVKRMMPGGMGARGIGIVALLILLGVGAYLSAYRVQPDQVGVVLRFGEFVRETNPGLHFKLPDPIESVETPSVTAVNRLDVGFIGGAEGRGATRDVPEESLMLTKDENIIDIDFTVLWRISNARAYLFNVRNPDQTIKAAAESSMREVIGQKNIQEALTGARAQIETETRTNLQAVLDQYETGITITQVQLQQVDPPREVIDAFNEVQRANQDRSTKINQAEAYRNQQIPLARGYAARAMESAQAYREEVVARAQGEAERFRQVLASYQTSPDVTARRLYLETLEAVFQGTRKVIIDQGANGSGQGVVPYLPLNELGGGSGTRPNPNTQNNQNTQPNANLPGVPQPNTFNTTARN